MSSVIKNINFYKTFLPLIYQYLRNRDIQKICCTSQAFFQISILHSLKKEFFTLEDLGNFIHNNYSYLLKRGLSKKEFIDTVSKITLLLPGDVIAFFPLVAKLKTFRIQKIIIQVHEPISHFDLRNLFICCPNPQSLRIENLAKKRKFTQLGLISKTKVRDLALRNFDLSEGCLKSFHSDVHTLKLPHCTLSKSLSVLASYHTLTSLDLTNTYINRTSLEELTNIHSLNTLILARNYEFNPEDIIEFLKKRSLDRLGVSSTAVDIPSISILRKLFPSVTLVNTYHLRRNSF